ncbi:uncharacterized protein [Amphiura filiformis]|uniref:uncharacterized protein n=1 Tax=Amphiura filiformis TaxID=82378 RepID=UPI003B2180B6
MGSPLSPIAVNLFMEWFENEAIATAPDNCKPRIWKRYVDDVLEVIKKGEAENLTTHLNQVDPTNSIKFTYEEESDNSIPFPNTLITKKDDGSLKICIYRKPTHTDQYLQFQSHHPLHHKLGVVRTLIDRKDSIVSEEIDRQKETSHIEQALNQCGYPQWSIKKVVEEKDLPKPKKSKPSDGQEKSKGLVVLPYVEGLSERVSRIFEKHGFATSLKPHSTIRKALVHRRTSETPPNSRSSV